MKPPRMLPLLLRWLGFGVFTPDQTPVVHGSIIVPPITVWVALYGQIMYKRKQTSGQLESAFVTVPVLCELVPMILAEN